MARYLSIFVLLALSAPASAAEYKPGTVGYFYEDCRRALEESRTLTELQATVCGAFAEGYAGGALVMTATQIGGPAQGDPCAEEKQKEFDRINDRMCIYLPKLDPKQHTAGRMLDTAVQVLTRWIDFEKKRGKSDPFKRDAAKELNKIITPGKFCDDLASSYPVQNPAFVINPALQKIKAGDFLNTRKNVSLRAKYEQCRKDIEAADGDTAAFSGTRCGAEISGYIAGLYSTAHLQKNRAAPSKDCKKQIDRLYRSMDPAQTMCVHPDTDPLQVAEIFLRRFEGMKKKNTDAVGAVGYETIYKGFLCAGRQP